MVQPRAAMTETVPDLPAPARPADWTMPAWRRAAWQYGIAPLALALAVAAKLALVRVLRGDASYRFFMPAILIASALSGWTLGLLLTTVSLMIGFYFVFDVRTPGTADYLNAAVFALVGMGVSWRGELLRRSRVAAATNAADAEARAAHLNSILDSIPEAMIVIDDRGNIVHSALRRSGYLAMRQPTFLGKNVKDADARAPIRTNMTVTSNLYAHRRAPHHRNRPCRRRPAQGWFDFSDGT